MKYLIIVLFFTPFLSFCQENTQQPEEFYKLNWPAMGNWIVGSHNEKKGHKTIELIHANETPDTWTEMGNMTLINGLRATPVDSLMKMIYLSALSMVPKAKLTFIQKNESARSPWILFSIESPGSTSHPGPESQLYYVITGSEGVYVNFIALKKTKLSEDFKKKWIPFLKSGKIMKE